MSSVQLLSPVWLFETPWTAAHQASLSYTNSQSLLKLMSIKSVMPPKNLIVCRPLLLLPSIFPSIRVFSSESVLHIRWPKYWSFSFNMNFQMFKLGLEKTGMRDLISNFVGSSNKQENTRKNIYFSFIDYAKVFDCINHKLWKILPERNTRPSYLPLEKSVCR